MIDFKLYADTRKSESKSNLKQQIKEHTCNTQDKKNSTHPYVPQCSEWPTE